MVTKHHAKLGTERGEAYANLSMRFLRALFNFAIAEYKVTEASGVAFTIHDLRRTYITIAESLDISAYALKRLVNHKMSNDVTAGYIISDVERLRDPMQRITSQLLAYFHQ